MKKTAKTILLALLLGLGPFLPAGAEQACNKMIGHSTPEDNFVINDDGTVTGKYTGLMWMRCSLGQTWDGKTCQGTAGIYSWISSLTVSSGDEFAGYKNWRLPNKNELESIVEVRCSSPAINTRLFPATPAAFFWTSSPYAGVLGGAWSVDFAYGTVNASAKTGKIHVRLVRDVENRIKADP